MGLIVWAVLLLPYLARFLFTLSTTDIEGMDGLASGTAALVVSKISLFSACIEVEKDVAIEGGKDEYSEGKNPTLGDVI